MSRVVALALAGLLWAAAPAGARELWRVGDASLAVSGSVRELVTWTRGTDAGDFAAAAAADPLGCGLAAAFPNCRAFREVGDERVVTSLTRLRTRVDLRLSPSLRAEVVYDHELFAGTLHTLGGVLGRSIAMGPWIDAQDRIASGGSGSHEYRWRHLLYRAYAALETKPLEVRIGRQRIAWGVGRLWSPMDRFNFVPPLALEADQTPGVDSALVRVLFTGFTFLEAVAAPQDDLGDGSYALRLHGVLRDVDYSVVAGLFEEARTLGFDLAGNLLGAAARLEVVYTDPERRVWPVGAPRRRELGDFWQVVVSVDRLFDVGSGLYTLVEHLYNGNALGFGRGRAGPLLPFFEQRGPGVVPTSPDRFGGSRVVTAAEQQTGIQLGYDLSPELRAEALAIYDWNGESASFFPLLRWSPHASLEITLGAQFFVGPRRSQYGDAEDVGYLLAEFFF